MLSLNPLCRYLTVIGAGYGPAYGTQAPAGGYTLFGNQPTVYLNKRRLLAYGSQTGGSYVGSYAAYAPAAYAPAAYAPDSATLAAPIPLAALSQVLANPAAGPVARSFAAAAAASSVGAAALGTGESWLAVLTLALACPCLGPCPQLRLAFCIPSSASGSKGAITPTGEPPCCHQTALLPPHLSTG